MAIPIWRGSSSLIECPDSPVITRTKQGYTYIRTFTGPYDACVSGAPDRFASAVGVPSFLFSDNIEIKKLPGGKGILTITFCPSPDPDADGSSPASSIHEIEWTEVQRPLAQHKLYQPGGDRALADTDWTRIKGWQSEQDEDLRSAFKFQDSKGTEFNLSDDAKNYCQKLLRGQESYNEYTPIARLTTPSTTKPTTGKCGMLTTSPPVEGIPDDYIWLKTADRACKRSHLWEHTQEWTGTWWWDTDIYASA